MIDGIHLGAQIAYVALPATPRSAAAGRQPPSHPPVLNLFRRSQRRALPVLATAPATAGGACALASCRAGSWAVVGELTCGGQEACRLRALGLCEGARVNVVDARNALLLEVRGTRIALGRALGAGITVRPIADGLGAPAPAPAG